MALKSDPEAALAARCSMRQRQTSFRGGCVRARRKQLRVLLRPARSKLPMWVGLGLPWHLELIQRIEATCSCSSQSLSGLCSDADLALQHTNGHTVRICKQTKLACTISFEQCTALHIVMLTVLPGTWVDGPGSTASTSSNGYTCTVDFCERVR
jgi:hypothetical protein